MLHSSYRLAFSLRQPNPPPKRGRYRNRGLQRLCTRADLYSILQVPETATKAEIKSAYRRLVRRWHPDLNPEVETTTRFQAVSDAYAVLSSHSLRQRYDAMGYACLGPQYAKYAAFGRGWRHHRAPEPGKDVMTVVWLDLVDAALGIERLVEVKIAKPCPSCGGASKQAAVSSMCQLCCGSGEVMRKHTAMHGKLAFLGSCPMCGGNGAHVQQWCTSCGGRGLARFRRLLRVRIPPGVDNDSVLKLKGSGDAGRFGGAPGDVYVTFVIRSSLDISRRGLDLHSKVTVAYTDAILGSRYQVQTIRGSTELDIPPGTQHGMVLTLDGAGIEASAATAVLEKSKQLPGRRAKTGSHHFQVAIRLPVETDIREQGILQELMRLQRKHREKTSL